MNKLSYLPDNKFHKRLEMVHLLVSLGFKLPIKILKIFSVLISQNSLSARQRYQLFVLRNPDHKLNRSL